MVVEGVAAAAATVEAEVAMVEVEAAAEVVGKCSRSTSRTALFPVCVSLFLLPECLALIYRVRLVQP